MLSNRLTAAMVFLVLLTSIGVGALIQRNIAQSVIPVELGRLQSQVDQRALELDTYVYGSRADALAAVHNPVVKDFANAMVESGGAMDESVLQDGRDAVAKYFVSELKVKSPYLQFRLINGQNGREIVRVDRSGPDGAIRVVSDSDLQDKSERSYFEEAMKTAAGSAHITPIELNQEYGVIEVPHVPVLRVAAPIYRAGASTDWGGEPIGVVVINVDMTPALESLVNTHENGCHRFVANVDGDYVLNTSAPESVFSSSLGGDKSWAKDFPQFVETIARTSRHSEMIKLANGDRFGAAMATWQLAGGPQVVLIETEPYDRIVGTAATVMRSSLIGALVAVALALVAAVVMARSLTKPLAELTRATKAFAEDKSFDLPTNSKGEIGILSRAFMSMSNAVTLQSDALRSEIEVRKQTEKELAAKNEKVRMFAAVVESSIDSIITMTLDGDITAWNRGAETIYGYSPEEAIGRNVEFLIPEDRKGEYDDILGLVRDGETVDQLETVRRHKCGLDIPVSIKASPLVASDGSIYGIAKISHDITAFKRAEQNFRLVIETTPSGIIVVDAGGRINLINPAAAKLFGYTRGELLGERVEKLVPLQSQTEHIALRAGYTASPMKRPMGEGRDLRGLRKDGTHFYVEIGLSPIQSDAGQQILCSIVDVTERRRAHKQLAQYASRLEQSNQDLQEFAYVVSHDLKAPLRGIASVADWVAQDFGDVVDDDARENLQLLKARIQRLEKLIEGILGYSRAGQKEMSRVNIRTEELVADIIDSIHPPQHIDVRIEGHLQNVLYDEAQLQQVFQNLVVNAINHMDKSHGEVTVSCEVDGSGCYFSVEDNGPGISERHFERIFGLFQTLRPKDECNSTGAGLAIVKRIVERNGGKVTVSSQEGRGSKFTFSVPSELVATPQPNQELAET